MSNSDFAAQSPRNGLYPLASVGGVLIGAFLLLGASGHFMAVWPALTGAADWPDVDRLGLVLPGLALAVPGLVDIGLCRALWIGRRWSLNLALAANLVVAAYLGYLLMRTVPDHPIGVFLALVSSYVLLLAGVRMGLVWPSDAPESGRGENRTA